MGGRQIVVELEGSCHRLMRPGDGIGRRDVRICRGQKVHVGEPHVRERIGWVQRDGLFEERPCLAQIIRRATLQQVTSSQCGFEGRRVDRTSVMHGSLGV